jgi:transposase
VGIASGERHEQTLVLDTLKSRFVDELPQRLIGDKAYDSDPLDAELANQGIDMIAPNLSTRAIQSQDRRKLLRYRRRWHIERLFAWLMRSRRLTTRWDCKAENFLGFVKLACVVILSRRLRDAF